jgi:low temperature requirement protein LtrA
VTARQRKVTWLELFFDLAFVAAVAQVSAPLAAEYTPAGLVRYAFLFLLIWWAWNGHANFSTRFDADDVVQRLLTLTQIFVVAVMAVNAKETLDSRSSAGFAAAYAGLRLLLVGQYLRARRRIASPGLATAYAAGFGAAAVIWLLSASVPPPLRFWFWAVALAVDLGTPVLTARLIVRLPPHAEHLPERFGLFTIILLGESMVAIMKGMESQEGWSAGAALSAFLGMAVTFLVWWWYFDGAGAAAERSVRSRNQARNLMIWNFAHFPMYLGIVITGVGIEHIIKIAPDGHLHAAEAWILAGAVALLMGALVTVEAMSDKPRSDRRGAWLTRCALAVLPIVGAPLGTLLPPAGLVATIALLCLVQLAFSTERSRLQLGASRAISA